MSRRKRNWNSKDYFHVIMRGNNRQNIFSGKEDMFQLFRVINYSHSQFSFEIVAFCIMTNHYHLLIKSEDDLAIIMRQINRRYSDYYSKRYNHVGRIYQKRYYAKRIVDPTILLMTSRYIHRNPIETKTPMVAVLSDYPFSSFPSYADKNNFYSFNFLTLHTLPKLLPKPYAQTKADYVHYCLAEEIEKQPTI